MKKILILMLAVLSCKCNGDEPLIGGPVPYEFGFQIYLHKVKAPNVKYIKIAVRNIDEIMPKYKAVLYSGNPVDIRYDKTMDTYFVTEQRKVRTSDGKTYYFESASVLFKSDQGWYYTAGEDRIFELKIYKNDDLFLTKKITLRSNKKPSLKDYWSEDPNDLGRVGYTDKVEVDNMDYVKEINVGDRDGRALVIEIPDKPIKK